MLSKLPYKGSRDFFPPQKRVQDFMFQHMRDSAESYGYEPYDGPMIEEVELYKAKSGEELINEQIYSFTDRGGRFVAMRPEMTPTLARMVAQIHREAPRPIRLYSIPNLWRYEKPQKGRLREHWQFNCDVFGGSGRRGEVEIMQVAISLLTSFGANSSMFEILINDRKIIDAFCQKILGLDPEQSYKLFKLIDRKTKIPAEVFQKSLLEIAGEKNVAVANSYLEITSFDGIRAFLAQHGLSDIAEDFNQFAAPLRALGLEQYVKYDPAIVRGLDYYTGIVFEIFDKNPENRRAICGGGAYADLLKIFNEPPLAGVGFGMGDVTLRDFLETHGLLPDLSTPVNDLFLACDNEANIDHLMQLAQALRGKGLKVMANLGALKFNKALPLAEKRGARFVGLLGERELADGKIQMKNLQTKQQQDIPLDDIEAMSSLVRLN